LVAAAFARGAHAARAARDVEEAAETPPRPAPRRHRSLSGIRPSLVRGSAAAAELIGTSTESWEKAAKAAVERASETLRDLRIAEVVEQDVQL
jgi:hypothetical protein